MHETTTQRAHRAAVIAVGTEITSGEIVNRNAASISDRLTAMGFDVALHISVPDESTLIEEALSKAVATARLVIVTGGLGPTSDDFTRDVIAKFTGKNLQWNEDAWQATTSRLRLVGAPISESNRQQCYFPEGSAVLSNSEGTAAGFHLAMQNFDLFALPGPPNEIAAIWRDHVSALLETRIPDGRKLILKRFICLGLSESKLGEIVEEVLKTSGLATGYRTRMPYVDVKVWVKPDQLNKFETVWRPKLEQAIGSYLFGRDGDDAAVLWLGSLAGNPRILILDAATAGSLASRLYNAKTNSQRPTLTIVNLEVGHNMPADLRAKVVSSLQYQASWTHMFYLTSNEESGEWRLSQVNANGTEVSHFSEISRYKGAHLSERLRAYICEKSLALLTTDRFG